MSPWLPASASWGGCQGLPEAAQHQEAWGLTLSPVEEPVPGGNAFPDAYGSKLGVTWASPYLPLQNFCTTGCR